MQICLVTLYLLTLFKILRTLIMLQLRLSEPILLSDKLSYVNQKWHRQCLLTTLSGIMKNFGCVDTSQCFATFNYNLMAVCDAADGMIVDGRAMFYKNFLLDVVVHCLRNGMKSVNDDLVRLSGHRKFRVVYSPSVLNL